LGGGPRRVRRFLLSQLLLEIADPAFFVDRSSLSNSALEGPAAGSAWAGGLSAANAMVPPAVAARIALANHGLHRPAIDKTMTPLECVRLSDIENDIASQSQAIFCRSNRRKTSAQSGD
jgi:hypothetical protein